MAVFTQEAEQVPVRRPDGDIELQDAGDHFTVPPCESCGGRLKPDVVFFGDSLPKERSQRAAQLAKDADLLLVVGSSLMVFSAFRWGRQPSSLKLCILFQIAIVTLVMITLR